MNFKKFFFGAGLSGHGYFFTKKFLVLAPVALASPRQTCAFNEFFKSLL